MLKVPLNDLRRAAAADHFELHDAIDRVVKSGWYVLGPEHDNFELELADYLNVGAAVALGNGTDALELAMVGVGVEAGSRVVTVANAGGYTSTAAAKLGATPVLVDIDAVAHLVDVDSLSITLEKFTVAAVVVTHLYGAMPDMERISGICTQAGVPLIEDCAQAIGAARGGKKAGTWGDIATFSFYPTKNLGALGDGGAVVTGDLGLAEKIRALRQYGWTSKYHMEVVGGRNSRLDEIQATVLRFRLGKVDALNDARRIIAAEYGRVLQGSANRLLHSASDSFVAHLAVIDSPRRDELQQFLEDHGIATAIHYPIPDHRQAGLQTQAAGPLSNTDKAVERVVTVPCFPELTTAEVKHVSDTLGRFCLL